MEQTKKCTKCGEVKELSLFRKSRIYYRSECKKCAALILKEWLLKNPNKKSEYDKKNYSKHRCNMLDKHKKYKLKNKEAIRERNKKYVSNNLEIIRAKQRIKKKNNVANISNWYVKERLRDSNVPITPETIELKRNIILIKRLTKKLKENGKAKTTGTDQ